MTNRYTVNEDTFLLEIYNDTQAEPYLIQPTWPNGDPWADVAEASNWAELFIEASINSEAPYAPSSRDEEPQAKPTPEQIAQWQAEWDLRNPNA